MGAKVELANTTRGPWMVIAEAGTDRHGRYTWLCECRHCGHEMVIESWRLQQFKYRACPGCLADEGTSQARLR